MDFQERMVDLEMQAPKDSRVIQGSLDSLDLQAHRVIRELWQYQVIQDLKDLVGTMVPQDLWV